MAASIPTIPSPVAPVVATATVAAPATVATAATPAITAVPVDVAMSAGDATLVAEAILVLLPLVLASLDDGGVSARRQARGGLEGQGGEDC
ncbi:hypothetical protein QBC33DRAFT_548209 [Phialemonium atrogriseum]|uniref:Uncharacterized protein n=1 Tax=Phialemonium atrogriseum TaxID=1093897 RepID=A0AAJ0FEB0_9PEZI|nr:uncharacterized protein QBC33DRAFT_548209 [Phialemonium atrogriseum]KAK1764142.1 hypothetical protein QBC33DRAFT_548209 [Phialemonium atrogriseum]